VEIRSSLEDYRKLIEALIWLINKSKEPLTMLERKKFEQLD
jgi:hypothetical protein